MDRLDGLGAKRHGTNTLNAAKHINFMSPTKMHSSDNGGIWLTFKRRWWQRCEARPRQKLSEPTYALEATRETLPAGT